MPHLTAILKVRMDEELRAALERQAALEGRDVSQLARNVLRAEMVAQGQLEEAAARG